MQKLDIWNPITYMLSLPFVEVLGFWSDFIFLLRRPICMASWKKAQPPRISLACFFLKRPRVWWAVLSARLCNAVGCV